MSREPGAELKRIQRVYAGRVRRLGDRAGPSAGDAFMLRARETNFRSRLETAGLPLADLKVLYVGCGRGERLSDWLYWGVRPERLFGVDLMVDFVLEAAEGRPDVQLAAAAASALPFADASFDLVVQAMMFSSILDPELRLASASSMARVLKPGGAILWYDMRYPNPLNPDHRPVRPEELRRLFAGWRIEGGPVTLAPPLSRLLAPLSVQLCEMLERRAPILRSHYLALLYKA